VFVVFQGGGFTRSPAWDNGINAPLNLELDDSPEMLLVQLPIAIKRRHQGRHGSSKKAILFHD
jgi:hypothetical protein